MSVAMKQVSPLREEQPIDVKTDVRESATLTTGMVMGLNEEDGYSILAAEMCTAQRAASCLVEPRVGDTVLLAALGNGECWVTAVLVASASRNVSLAGPEIHMQGEAVNVQAAKLKTSSEEWHALHEALEYTGARMQCRVGSLQWIGQMVMGTLERLVSKSRCSLREVKELDQSHVGYQDVQVDEVMSLRAKNGFVTAQGVLRMDGENIQVG